MENSIHRTRSEDGTRTVSVRGEVDYSNAEELAQTLRDAADDGAPALIRVDLTGVTFIDSTGLGALIEGYRASGEVGARFIVTNPTPAFHRVLTVTGLSDFFGLDDLNDTLSGSAAESPSSAQATGS